jgi:lauroyl/myristoyl acyltransferase
MRRDLTNYLFWLFVRAPSWVSRSHVAALCMLARTARFAPGNPVVESLNAVSRIAARHGERQDPVVNYRAFLDQIHQAGLGYLELMREGPAVVDRRVEIPPEVAAIGNEQLSKGRGLVVAVPHNTGGILTTVGFARAFPSRVLLRNSTSPQRDQMMMDLFERLDVDAYLTRNDSPSGMFRACLGALRKGKVLLLTLDNIDPGRASRVDVSMFGRNIPFPSWGARIALQAKAPLVPAWVTTHDGMFRIDAGDAIQDATLEETMQHYASYFERRIIDSPADWLFLGHKRWKRVLVAAAEGDRGGV